MAPLPIVAADASASVVRVSIIPSIHEERIHCYINFKLDLSIDTYCGKTR
jgi:hypothetical protein